MIFLACLIVSCKICMPELCIDPDLKWTRMDFSIKQLSLIEAEAAGLLLAVQKPNHRTGAIVLSPQLSGNVHERTKLLDSQGSLNVVAEPPPRCSFASLSSNKDTYTGLSTSRNIDEPTFRRPRAGWDDVPRSLDETSANSTVRPLMRNIAPYVVIKQFDSRF